MGSSRSPTVLGLGIWMAKKGYICEGLEGVDDIGDVVFHVAPCSIEIAPFRDNRCLRNGRLWSVVQSTLVTLDYSEQTGHGVDMRLKIVSPLNATPHP